jgi:hypothetical protein
VWTIISQFICNTLCLRSCAGCFVPNQTWAKPYFDTKNRDQRVWRRGFTHRFRLAIVAVVVWRIVPTAVARGESSSLSIATMPVVVSGWAMSSSALLFANDKSSSSPHTSSTSALRIVLLSATSKPQAVSRMRPSVDTVFCCGAPSDGVVRSRCCCTSGLVVTVAAFARGGICSGYTTEEWPLRCRSWSRRRQVAGCRPLIHWRWVESSLLTDPCRRLYYRAGES